MKTQITDTQITPAQLLTAARAGKITASVIEAETLPPLAGGDGPEQYPVCTIALQVELPVVLDTEEATLATQTLRTIEAWKYVYYSIEGDTLNSGRGTYDFRAVRADQCTRGDVTVTVDDGDGDGLLEIVITTGESMSGVPVISIDGLTEDEAEEVRDAIESAIHDAYGDWDLEHPSEDEIYAALVSKKRETATIDADIAGETISVKLYADTHCGQPQFAFEGDENERVYDDAADCATEARGRLEELFAAAKEKLTTVSAIITEAGNGFPSDGSLVYDSTGNTVYEVVSTGNIQTGRSSGAGNWVTATLKEADETDPTAYSNEDWEAVSDCSVCLDEDGPQIDTAALDRQEREAAETLEASLRNDG